MKRQRVELNTYWSFLLEMLLEPAGMAMVVKKFRSFSSCNCNDS